MRDLVQKFNELCEALPDGTPGFTAAYQLMGRMARLAWDRLGG